MIRFSTPLIHLIFIVTAFGCAAPHPAERPDDGLMAAIRQNDCRALWEQMTEDVRHYFQNTDAFCAYYDANRTMFVAWATRIHDRLMADDIAHYASLPNDPEGAMRLRKSDGQWHFDTPVIAANVYDETRMKARFGNYLRSHAFRNDLQAYLERTKGRHANTGMGKFLRAIYETDAPADIRFEGPFARISWNAHPVEIIYYYRKPAGAEDGAWELYRCLF